MSLLAQIRHDGPAGARPCLIAHGLFGSARNWNAVAKRLSAARPVIAVDMRNHGASFHADAHDYTDLAGDLAAVIGDIGAGPLDVIGHSMGGKAAMVLALTRPDLVARVLVADMAPIAYGHSQQPYIDKMRAVDLSAATRRSDVAQALAAQGVAPELQSFFTQSLDLAQKRWRYNLDALERAMPAIMGFPALEGSFDGPSLFLAGGTSAYVPRSARPAIKALFPKARFASLRGAGHWLHAEKPREFVTTANAFFA